MGTLVLALNPSIDAEWRVNQVQWEEKNVIRAERRWAGGKGVNVARWLRFLRGDPELLLPLGGTTGTELARCLRGEKLPAAIVSLHQATRVNVIVTTADGRQLRFNPPGPELSRVEWLAVLREMRRLLARVSCVVISGSEPRGVGAGAYAEIVRHAHRAGVKAILDCDGKAFRAAVRARPLLVKPNEHELAQWYGRPLRSEASVVRAAKALSMQTRGWVVVSRGKDGAVLVNAREGLEFSARPPRIKPINTVGAGDAMVAAVAREIGRGTPPQEWLRRGVAIGTAATQCAAGKLPPIALIKRLSKQIVVEQD
jgi:1-phosphofructokinase family hexose kinase